MLLFALTPTQLAGGQILLAAILAIVGFALLLPRPRGRSVSGGIAALVAAVSVFGAWLQTAYGNPMPDQVGSVLFGLFSLGALVFGTVLVVQRNPARGAIAFAFVILSTCGLFLLLAAPFLMAVTIIIYAGAIIVTFLFVLMLSQVQGPSDENDRSREPLFGSLAGFAFAGLVLFTVYLTALGNNPAKAESSEGSAPKATQRLPAPVLTDDERKSLSDAITKLDAVDEQLNGDLTLAANRDQITNEVEGIKTTVSKVVGVAREDVLTPISPGSLRERLEKSPGKAGGEPVLFREDTQARAILKRAAAIRELNWQTFKKIEQNMLGKPDAEAAKAEIRQLRDEVLLLSGEGELPARNVGNLGALLYTQYLLAVELAGTLLLVATIGAVAIAQRRGVAQ